MLLTYELGGIESEVVGEVFLSSVRILPTHWYTSCSKDGWSLGLQRQGLFPQRGIPILLPPLKDKLFPPFQILCGPEPPWDLGLGLSMSRTAMGSSTSFFNLDHLVENDVHIVPSQTSINDILSFVVSPAQFTGRHPDPYAVSR